MKTKFLAFFPSATYCGGAYQQAPQSPDNAQQTLSLSLTLPSPLSFIPRTLLVQHQAVPGVKRVLRSNIRSEHNKVVRTK